MDMLNINKNKQWDEKRRTRIRHTVHIIFALLFFVIVMIFKSLDDRAIIDTILKIAGYTYGPLLGLFMFGMLTSRRLPNGLLLVAAALSAPVICYLVQYALAKNPSGYQIGIELLLINGALTFALLWLVSQKAPAAFETTSTF